MQSSIEWAECDKEQKQKETVRDYFVEAKRREERERAKKEHSKRQYSLIVVGYKIILHTIEWRPPLSHYNKIAL